MQLGYLKNSTNLIIAIKQYQFNSASTKSLKIFSSLGLVSRSIPRKYHNQHRKSQACYGVHLFRYPHLIHNIQLENHAFHNQTQFLYIQIFLTSQVLSMNTDIEKPTLYRTAACKEHIW